MAYDLWVPSAKPQLGTGGNLDQAVLGNNFGDRYRQVMQDGLNSVQEVVPLIWNGVTLVQLQGLQTHWKQKGKATPFRYILPWQDEELLWRYDSPLTWNAIGRLYTANTALRQDYSLS